MSLVILSLRWSILKNHSLRAFILLLLPFLYALLFEQQVIAQQTHAPPPASFTWTPIWQVDRARPGYRLLEDVDHFVIQKPSIAAGAYHHHPQITNFSDQFFACWSSHRSGEDGPGQRVLFSSSSDGVKWNEPVELFPPIDHVKVSTQTGRALTALGFVKIGENLYAVAEAHDNTGYVTHDQWMSAAPQSLKKEAPFTKRSRKGLGRLIRQLNADATFGKIFWINEDPPAAIEGFENFPVADTKNVPDIGEIKQKLATPLQSPTWDFKNDTTELLAADGVLLTEPTTWQPAPSQFCRLWRAQNHSFKMYSQTSTDGIQWSPAVATPIPDAPAKTVTAVLPSGETVLVGNQVYNKKGTRRDPLTIAIARNGFDFDRAYSIRWRTPKFRTPRQQTEVDGRGTGFQYPSVIVRDGFLWVIYSVNKEAVDVSRINITSLLNYSPCDYFSQTCIQKVVDQSTPEFRGVRFDDDAVLLGLTSERRADDSYRLKMAWQLNEGRRPTRFIHLSDANGKVLRQGDRNKALFDSVQGSRTVFDSVDIPADQLAGVTTIAIGFYGPDRKSAQVIRPANTSDKPAQVSYKLNVLQLE